MMLSLKNLLIGSSIIPLLVACGGGSSSSSDTELYQGSTEPAVASEENKLDLVTAGALGAKQALQSQSIPIAATAESSTALTIANEAVTKLLQLNTLPSGVDVSDDVCPDGGSASVEGDEDSSDVINSALTKLEDFALKTGATVIMVHHLRKGKRPKTPSATFTEIRGSSAITDRARLTITFCRNDGITLMLSLIHI